MHQRINLSMHQLNRRHMNCRLLIADFSPSYHEMARLSFWKIVYGKFYFEAYICYNI